MLLQHPAFLRRKAGFAGRHGLEHVLELGARMPGPAEQLADARTSQFSPFSDEGGTGTGRLRGS